MPQIPHIFIAEDHQKYFQIYKMTLEDAFECEITFAPSGTEAIQILNQSHFDLLILDFNLPDMTGEDILQHVRKDLRHTGVPVIFLTAENSPDLPAKLLEMGADDFIEKGCSPENLIARVRVQLRHKLSIDRATELAMEVDAFTTGVLHDIRNFENSIVSSLYLMQMLVEEDPEKNAKEIVESLQDLQNKAGTISDYASGILDRVKETHEHCELQEMDLEKIIQEVNVYIFGDKDNQESYELQIKQSLKPIIADEHFLKLVLFNIIQNSIKYSNPGEKPRVEVKQKFSADHTVVQIRDFGIGISKKDLIKVFKPFTRGKTRGMEGFGLGLSMVSRAMDKMSGSVWAELPEDGGQGTVICLKFVNSIQQNQSA